MVFHSLFHFQSGVMDEGIVAVATARWDTVMSAVPVMTAITLTATTEDVTTGEYDSFYLCHSIDLKLVLMQLNSSEFTSTAI